MKVHVRLCSIFDHHINSIYYSPWRNPLLVIEVWSDLAGGCRVSPYLPRCAQQKSLKPANLLGPTLEMNKMYFQGPGKRAYDT